MNVNVETDQAMLTACGISQSELEQAVATALGTMEHPETGDPIYSNGIRVTATIVG